MLAPVCLYHAAGDVAELTTRLNEVASMSDSARAGLASAAQQYALRFDRARILDNLLSTAAQRTTTDRRQNHHAAYPVLVSEHQRESYYQVGSGMVKP